VASVARRAARLVLRSRRVPVVRRIYLSTGR
jgi:hypothetical protein